jgi:HEAT repeat protein
MAAVFACGPPVHPEKAMILQEIIGSDADIDVRLAATRALQNFDGQAAIGALAIALDDPSPALQLRAAESLQVVTGEKHGTNIRAWQEYVRQSVRPDATSDSPQTADMSTSSPEIVR